MFNKQLTWDKTKNNFTANCSPVPWFFLFLGPNILLRNFLKALDLRSSLSTRDRDSRRHKHQKQEQFLYILRNFYSAKKNKIFSYLTWQHLYKNMGRKCKIIRLLCQGNVNVRKQKNISKIVTSQLPLYGTGWCCT